MSAANGNRYAAKDSPRAYLGVRLPASLLLRLKAAAKANLRSATAEIEARLIASFVD